jgi:heterotetrameric sarcosine oxidase delta subunit
MLLINCPWCGAREETEFHCGGEAHIVRPAQPSSLSDDHWADYLFMRTNPKGVHLERWCHEAGCGRWFNAARDTVTDRFLAVYKMGETCPPLPADGKASPGMGDLPGKDGR